MGLRRSASAGSLLSKASQRMTFRKATLTVHLIGGLISAIFLTLLGLTGSVLVFEGEIDHLLNRSLTHVQPQGERRSLSELCQMVEQRHPGSHVDSVNPSYDPAIAYKIHVRSAKPGETRAFAVNPYTGEELGSLEKANQWMAKVHQFHTNLLLGPNGKVITGISAMFLFGLSVTGLIVWMPAKMWKLSVLRRPRAGNWEVHNLLGFYSSLFMFLFAITGLVIHWDNETRTLINRWTGEVDVPPTKPVAPFHGPARLDAGQLMDAALKAVPGAHISTMLGIGGNGPVRVIMKYPEDGTPAGRTNLALDPATGEVLFRQTSRTANWGVKIAKLWNREIHTGDIYGLPTRILAGLMSFALPVLALTGPLIWWARIRRKRAAISEAV